MFDAVRKKMLLQYATLPCSKKGPGGEEQCTDTKQMESADHGETWTEPASVCGTAVGKIPPAACGGAVGPGVGIQLQHPAKAPGRILWIGHYGAQTSFSDSHALIPTHCLTLSVPLSYSTGAYGHDTVWYSDDGGATFEVSMPPLEHMDEAQLVELPNGDVLANMRSAHFNKTCDCRAVATSTDGGKTFGPIEWVPELISPVCMGSVLKGPGGAVYFANPANKTSRTFSG